MLRIGIELDFAGAYGRSVLRGVVRYAQVRSDWEFVLPPMYSLASMKLKLADRIDGLITMIHSVRTLKRYRRQSSPLVNVARTLSAEQLQREGIVSVLPDEKQVAEMIFADLWERRFRSFAFCGHPSASWSRCRERAFIDICRQHGATVLVAHSTEEAPARWIRSLPKPCAVMGANDRYAWNVIDTCRNCGLAVPEEIAVIGADNDTFLTEMARPTLSSAELGGDRIGFEAARLLDLQLSGEPAPQLITEIAPLGVMTRHSTDVLSIEDAVVAEAVQFIRQNASKQFSVEDVLDAVAMSRRNLERRFRRVMQRSLLDEIRRVHIDRSAKLLRETNLTIPQIATQSGYASHVRFSTVFKEQMQITPTDYRRRFRSGLS
ncbi:MAG: XylR family transcriptional regulator [Tepidisphaeraceae bacterium]